MIPQKLEKVLKSDLSFLTFGAGHPETILCAEFLQDGNKSPTFAFGPADYNSELSLHLRPRKDTEYKVGELHSYSGVVDFCLTHNNESKICNYRMHMKRETLPSNLHYTPVSWEELMIRSR